MTTEIDGDRLLEQLATLARIGATGDRGITRLAFSDADRQAREQVVKWMHELDLTVHIDVIGNIFAVHSGAEDLPPVMCGSHIDTVISAGPYDGSYGVLAGLAACRALKQAGTKTRRPIAIGVFSNEEGVRYQPDMMGSLGFAGGYELETALATVGTDGTILGEELHKTGFAGTANLGEPSPHSFVELHIEQGPVLEQEGICIGVVEAVQGISWQELTFIGQANHAGTTPMELRRDAGYGAAVTVTFLHDLAHDLGGGQVATAGVIEFKPAAINVVPGEARLTVDMRNADDVSLQEAERRLAEHIAALADDQNLQIKARQLVRFEPVEFSARIVDTIEDVCNQRGLASRRMVSGAVHDAQMIARVCPAAMIFVPSSGGISHNPDEHTEPQQLIAGANVLLHSLIRLAQ